jgi:hypothetical protein
MRCLCGDLLGCLSKKNRIVDPHTSADTHDGDDNTSQRSENTTTAFAVSAHVP